jgi:CBS-domain-containing membrane protein
MMTVEKIMRRDVSGVHPDDPIATARRHLLAQEVPTVPVLDTSGHVLGVLTEEDLLVRALHRRPRPWWELMFGDPARLARQYRARVGTTAGDVMRPASTTVHPDDAVEHAAALMHTHRLAVLLVVADDALVGILTRADLIDHVAEPAPSDNDFSDPAELVREMERRMRDEPWVPAHAIRVDADHGVIRLYGLVRSEAERAGLLTMARAIPGCIDVENHLLVRTQLASI